MKRILAFAFGTSCKATILSYTLLPRFQRLPTVAAGLMDHQIMPVLASTSAAPPSLTLHSILLR